MKSKALGNFTYLQLLLLHVGFAVAIYIYRPISLLISTSVLIFFTFYIIQKKNRNNEALMAAAYISGAEVFFRMTDGLLFYETGKYAVIIYLLIGMFFKGTSSRTVPFWIYLFILVPGILIASIDLGAHAEFRKLIAFNLSGPVSLGVSALYCYYKKIKREDFNIVLLMFALPLIANMFYLYLYTPRLDEAMINVGANYAATGGYGPNQISTIFGFGCFILTLRLFVVKNKIINLIEILLIGLMGYRAVVTFSRGGVITGIVCIIFFLIIYYSKQTSKERSRIHVKFIFLAGLMLLVWSFSYIQTSGLIGNRYSNEDAAGRLKTDITTGRTELIKTELEGFYQNPALGMGVGRAKELRSEDAGGAMASHNEISRLLSEHGLLGVLAILILILVPIIFWTKFKNNYYFLAFLAFWFLTINHSAMRIALPGFVYGLALLYIVDDKKNSLHR